MEITFEQLTHENYNAACAIDRDDIPESFVDTASTIMEINEKIMLRGVKNGNGK